MVLTLALDWAGLCDWAIHGKEEHGLKMAKSRLFFYSLIEDIRAGIYDEFPKCLPAMYAKIPAISASLTQLESASPDRSLMGAAAFVRACPNPVSDQLADVLWVVVA